MYTGTWIMLIVVALLFAATIYMIWFSVNMKEAEDDEECEETLYADKLEEDMVQSVGCRAGATLSGN